MDIDKKEYEYIYYFFKSKWRFSICTKNSVWICIL